MTEERLYDPEEWEHGLRCAECSDEFVEGQPIAELLQGVDRFHDGEPVFTVLIVCVACSLVGAA